jgi:hypothetical protein
LQHPEPDGRTRNAAVEADPDRLINEVGGPGGLSTPLPDSCTNARCPARAQRGSPRSEAERGRYAWRKGFEFPRLETHDRSRRDAGAQRGELELKVRLELASSWVPDAGLRSVYWRPGSSHSSGNREASRRMEDSADHVPGYGLRRYG